MTTTLRERVRAGDPAAFGELFDQAARRVYNHVYRLLGDWSAAEDAVSLTFLEAWRCRGRLDAEGGPLLPWLLGIATNTARNTARARRRHTAAMARTLLPPPHDEVPLPHRSLHRDALVRELSRASSRRRFRFRFPAPALAAGALAATVAVTAGIATVLPDRAAERRDADADAERQGQPAAVRAQRHGFRTRDVRRQMFSGTRRPWSGAMSAHRRKTSSLARFAVVECSWPRSLASFARFGSGHHRRAASVNDSSAR
ncbi:RNA polymerase sigma-70 factor, ECF subfamily [Cryptosporangium aurantiacum]|uniref:RNA polymerase sigma-70 factor, ECF subfamily n=1 Tax=Cryptosporangium aurantiacum TaxID=134849 RepID=A0A1M7RM06_9ACTN|nr:RNA polymerase sigma-70 factor, ECF subfamily [Cryptosporangium aurantiacum]